MFSPPSGQVTLLGNESKVVRPGDEEFRVSRVLEYKIRISWNHVK